MELDRREFLKSAGLSTVAAAGSILLEACGGNKMTAPSTPNPNPNPNPNPVTSTSLVPYVRDDGPINGTFHIIQAGKNREDLDFIIQNNTVIVTPDKGLQIGKYQATITSDNYWTRNLTVTTDGNVFSGAVPGYTEPQIRLIGKSFPLDNWKYWCLRGGRVQNPIGKLKIGILDDGVYEGSPDGSLKKVDNYTPIGNTLNNVIDVAENDPSFYAASLYNPGDISHVFRKSQGANIPLNFKTDGWIFIFPASNTLYGIDRSDSTDNEVSDNIKWAILAYTTKGLVSRAALSDDLRESLGKAQREIFEGLDGNQKPLEFFKDYGRWQQSITPGLFPF